MKMYRGLLIWSLSSQVSRYHPAVHVHNGILEIPPCSLPKVPSFPQFQIHQISTFERSKIDFEMTFLSNQANLA